MKKRILFNSQLFGYFLDRVANVPTLTEASKQPMKEFQSQLTDDFSYCSLRLRPQSEPPGRGSLENSGDTIWFLLGALSWPPWGPLAQVPSGEVLYH